MPWPPRKPEVAEVAEVLEANGLFEWLRVQTLSLVPCRRVTRCEVLPGRFFRRAQGESRRHIGIMWNQRVGVTDCKGVSL